MIGWATVVLVSVFAANSAIYVSFPKSRTVLDVVAPVIFSDESLVVDLRFGPRLEVARTDEERVGQWRLYRKGDSEPSLLVGSLSEPVTRSYERFDLGRLPVGDYELERVENGIASTRKAFAVREGDESPELVLERLRHLANYAETYEEAKQLFSQLSKLEPNNPYVFEQLANRALREDRPEESLRLLQEARLIVQRNIARREQALGKRLPSEELDSARKALDRYSLLESIFQFYKEHQSELYMSPASFAQPYGYVWVRRSDNKVIGAVDPSKENMLAPMTFTVWKE